MIPRHPRDTHRGCPHPHGTPRGQTWDGRGDLEGVVVVVGSLELPMVLEYRGEYPGGIGFLGCTLGISLLAWGQAWGDPEGNPGDLGGISAWSSRPRHGC